MNLRKNRRYHRVCHIISHWNNTWHLSNLPSYDSKVWQFPSTIHYHSSSVFLAPKFGAPRFCLNKSWMCIDAKIQATQLQLQPRPFFPWAAMTTNYCGSPCEKCHALLKAGSPVSFSFVERGWCADEWWVEEEVIMMNLVLGGKKGPAGKNWRIWNAGIRYYKLSHSGSFWCGTSLRGSCM